MTQPPTRSLVATLLTVVLLAAPRPARSAWPQDPTVNVPVCTVTGSQSSPTSVSDGAGGAIVTWQDYRNGNWDIYAQRISADGTIQWAAGGVALCTAAWDQQSPAITSDGASGAVVTWHDGRSGSDADIYAQRVSAAGTVQWTADGIALCTAAFDQSFPAIATDGAGGAIVTWGDKRDDGLISHIYVQRISADGTILWMADGIALSTSDYAVYPGYLRPSILSDGAGGAIVAFGNPSPGNVVYAQGVSADGTVQWQAGGVFLGSHAGSRGSLQLPVSIVSDGAGGAIVAWAADRTVLDLCIYAQRITADGAVLWMDDMDLGTPEILSPEYTFSDRPVLVSDGLGGAILAWRCDSYSSDAEIRVSRISPAGEPLWTADGVPLCTDTGGLSALHTIVSDGEGGALVAWGDLRSGGPGIYAQRISTGGTVQWTANGVALCTAPGDRGDPVIASDGVGGALLAWPDQRSGDWDIYAQRVDKWGYLCGEPVIASVRDVPNDQGGKLKVSWYSSCFDVAPDFGISSYSIWRSVPPNYAALALSRGARLIGSDEATPRPGGATFTTSTESGQTIFWEYVGSQVAAGDVGYSYVVPTTSDSVAASNPRTLVRVQARASSRNLFWNSAPDSGYSVDDLAPPAPAPFSGEYAGGIATLRWAANPAADLAEYRLYRGSTADFVPEPGNLVVARPDTGYVDVAGAPYYYKLCAVDLHGNASSFSTLLPSGTVGTPLPRVVSLAPPAPNPTRGATTLRFGLPRAAHVELALYDQQGRRVRSLVAGTQPAGERTLTWDGCDESGRALPAGLYFVRLMTEGRTFVSRLAVIH